MTTPIRSLAAAALAIAVLFPSAALAQTGEALIQKVGASSPVPNVTFGGDRTVEYKVAWDVTEGPAKPSDATAGFARAANFLVMADANGLDRRKVHLALIVHGTATSSLLGDAAYRAMHGVDNPNVALLQALNDAGVQIIVCGQALINRKVPRDGLLPFVKVATSATFARATLHAQGYATFTP